MLDLSEHPAAQLFGARAARTELAATPSDVPSRASRTPPWNKITEGRFYLEDVDPTLDEAPDSDDSDDDFDSDENDAIEDIDDESALEDEDENEDKETNEASPDKK